MDAFWREEEQREHAVRLDFKSLFVFGDLVLAAYVAMSERVWDAPPSVPHWDGLTKFVGYVRRLRDEGQLAAGTNFAYYMDLLFDRIAAIDQSFGWYRDKWVVHLPREMMASPGWGVTVPLSFHISYARREEIADAQMRALRKTIRQVEKREGLDLGDGAHDPRPKLRKLALLLHQLKQESSVKTVQNLLVQWGGHSPPLLETATGLATLLEEWSSAFVSRVGLMSDD